jgi:ABC-2 type transport system permease protein
MSVTAWPTARPSRGGRAGLVLVAAALQARSAVRAPEFLAGALLVPLLLYGMFGMSNGSTLPAGTPVATFMLVSIGAYGVVSLAIFVLGEDVAKERGRGWIRTLHATGFPPAVHLGAKTLSGVGHALLVVVALGLLAGLGAGVDLAPGQWLGLGATLVGGFVAFAPLGLAIAFLVRPRTATVVANVVFLPLSFASGFFVPLAELPAVVADVGRHLPTTHLGQLAYRTVMPASDVEAMTGLATRPVAVHLAWVVGSAVVLAALALWGARREGRTRRG